MPTLRLARPDDVDGFLRGLRQALALRLDPADVAWDDGSQPQASLLADEADAAPPPAAPDGPPLLLPRSFLALARCALLHDDPGRHRLVHALAAAILRDRRHWADALDPSRLRLERMAREVRREIHKMHAFVRFRVVADAAGECRVAWFEPAHHVVRAAAPFFVDRFAAMRWALLTPRGCVHWDLRALAFGPPASKADAPAADDGEALWLAYYRSIFNPARVKLAMMQREMPVRFWKNLPEAAQVTAMLQQADARAFRMQASTDGPRRHRSGKGMRPERG